MKLVLVIPCYNEAARLERRAFEACPHQLLFVDDGSSDGTAELVASWGLPHAEVLRLAPNGGKAEAVRRGMLHALSAYPDVPWIGFWDADLSAPLSEASAMLRWQELFYPEAASVWGSRVLRLGAAIRRRQLRHLLGRGFATLVTLLFGVTPYDTQCGAKLFARPAVAPLFEAAFTSAWFFDVELLLRAQAAGVAPVEFPLAAWEEKAGSKLKLWRTSVRGLWELWRMRRRYR